MHVLGIEILQSLFTDLTPFCSCPGQLWDWDDVKILSCPQAPCRVTPETVLFPWKWKPALRSYLLLTLTTGSTPEASREDFLSWVTSHPDHSHPAVTLTQKCKPTNGHPGHSKDKPSLGIMQKKSHNSSWQINSSLLEGTMWWTTRALAFSAHWHWRLQREIDIITRHNQNDNIMQHLQLIFTFQSLERLFFRNSLVSKRNLPRQLLWFSLQPGHVKKVRKLL